jgi:hypothetical protein
MTDREPTADELAGMRWWNEMTEKQRGEAMQLAKATTAAQAWDHFKLMMQIENEIHGTSSSPEAGGVTQDAKSWEAGYKAGHSGTRTETPPPAIDALAWHSGVIEGQADRKAGKVRPMTRKPQP